MKKISKRITSILGTTTLAVGLLALPALAETTQQQGSSWFSKMHGYMQNNFFMEQHQTLMNSTEMQNFHNSQGMQSAMQSGDVRQMQELMNSDPTVRTHMGQENLDNMNEFMANYGANMMNTQSPMGGSFSSMMNGRVNN